MSIEKLDYFISAATNSSAAQRVFLFSMATLHLSVGIACPERQKVFHGNFIRKA